MPGAGCLLFLAARSRSHEPDHMRHLIDFGKQPRTVINLETGHREAFVKAFHQSYGRNHSP
jgi:hypothetical protein